MARKYRTQDHRYKGFVIGYSDYRCGWVVEPALITNYPNADENKLSEISILIRDLLGEFSTLKEAKNFVDENLRELTVMVKETLVEKYPELFK